MDKISQITSPDQFTKLCKYLFAAEYNDFQTIDDSGGDKGNDGYLESQKTLFQIYCPKKPSKANDSHYKSKIKGAAYREPEELVEEIKEKERRISTLLKEIFGSI